MMNFRLSKSQLTDTCSYKFKHKIHYFSLCFCLPVKKKKMHPSKVLLATLFFFTLAPWATASKVTYDGRAIIIDGKHRLLVSGSIHYPRSTAQVYLFIFFY